MLNKIKKMLIVLVCGVMATGASFADDELTVDVDMEDVSADAVANYDVNGSVFKQITDLEQEKVLMQLEKEKAQLDLDLDRLAAEKIKLHMEIDALSGRAETQQQEIEVQMAKLEAEAAKLEQEKAELAEKAEEKSKPSKAKSSSVSSVAQDEEENPISKKYKLVNVIGAGSQLQATVTDLVTGQNKRISVGKSLDGFVVKSISLDEGVVLVKGGEKQVLNVVNTK
ncbi:MAG: type IV pilus biogenesis protein PilP [Alphaproteobacteria bacterium]|nr:type IV pilus biogenesis protein PilP [Alphaproteobacteria bacterium]